MRKIIFQVVLAALAIFASSCSDKGDDKDNVIRHQYSDVTALSIAGESSDIVVLEFSDGTNKTLTVMCFTTVGYDNNLRAGTYTPSNKGAGMTFVPGASDDEGDYGTYLFEDDGAGGGYTRYFTSGSISVSNGVENGVVITIDLVDSLGEKLSAEYRGPLVVSDEGATTGIVYAEAQYYGADSGLDLWALLLSTSRRAEEACTDILLMFYTPIGDASSLPLNVYPMASAGGNFSANTAVYGQLKDNSRVFGCWYLVSPDGLYYNYIAPAVASMGWVKTSSRSDGQHAVYFRFYDSSGNRYSGSYVGEIKVYDQSTRSSLTQADSPTLRPTTTGPLQDSGMSLIPSVRRAE